MVANSSDGGLAFDAPFKAEPAIITPVVQNSVLRIPVADGGEGRNMLVYDVKEVWGAGQQQVCNIWTNEAALQLCLWMHTLVELWAWNRTHDELVDRSDRPGTIPNVGLRTPTVAKSCHYC